MYLLLTTGNFKPGVYAVSVTGRLPPGALYLTGMINCFSKVEFPSFTFNLYLLFMVLTLFFCISEGVVRELKSRGVIYKSRDTAVKT